MTTTISRGSHFPCLNSFVSKANFRLCRIHQDIRPENILLKKGPSESPYKFTPKVADFGLYSRVRTVRERSGGSGMGLDHYGNQQFSKETALIGFCAMLTNSLSRLT